MQRSLSHGFTILELIIAIALVAILLGLAIPNMRTALQNNRLTAQSNDFIAAVQLARSEAIKRGSPVSICATEVVDGDPNPNCSNDWAEGWMVVEDAPNSAGSNAVNIVNRLRIWRPSSDDITVALNNPVDFLRFLPRGQLDASPGAGAVFPLEFSLENDGCTGEQARQIEVVRSGRASVTRVGCP